MRIRWLLILLLVVFLGGCFFQVDDGEPTFHIVYEETFDNAASYAGTHPWFVSSSESAATWVADSALQIRVDKAQWVRRSYVDGISLGSAFRIDVFACRVAGPIDNEFGVIFRRLDGDNYMQFSISSDGYMRFRKQIDDKYSTPVKWTTCDEISLEEACYQITVVGNGSEYDFYVNRVWVLSMTDTSFQGGQVGVMAATLDDIGVHIAFTEVYISEPD